MRIHEILNQEDAFYLDKQKSFVPNELCGMLVFETLKSKISDFLNSNMCFYLQLYGTFAYMTH